MDKKRKARWLKQLHQWHWVSSAICLISLLLFSLTGITLNHAESIGSDPAVDQQKTTLPAHLQALLDGEDQGPLPDGIQTWLQQEMGLNAGDQEAEWYPQEVYLAFPRPGGDAWVAFDRDSGEVESETTDRGWIAFFNDLHKGRHTGKVWFWFIDIFAIASLLFALTGLGLMALHAKRRPSTWPVTLAGLILPWLLIVFFVVH